MLTEFNYNRRARWPGAAVTNMSAGQVQSLKNMGTATGLLVS